MLYGMVVVCCGCVGLCIVCSECVRCLLCILRCCMLCLFVHLHLWMVVCVCLVDVFVCCVRGLLCGVV